VNVRRVLAPLLAGLLGLAGALGATLYLHRAAAAAVQRVLEERLRGAGEAAAAMIDPSRPEAAPLAAVMGASRLEGAYLLSRELRVLADATGPAGGRADLLRVDEARVAAAFEGRATVDFAFAVGDQPIATGYFPVRGPGGGIAAVLALEAGQEFAAVRRDLERARQVGIGLSALVALALGAAAFRWARSEAGRRTVAERAARGEAQARMAAAVAHEVRNPLGIIRGAAELIGARSGDRLVPADSAALRDILDEVQRLNRLTEDFLDLSREPRLEPVDVELGELAAEAARGVGHAFADLEVRVEMPPLRVRVDPDRLRQVLANLLANAGQAGARRVEVRGRGAGGVARIEICDDGPGIPADLRARLFDPFATGRPGGTGLGLAISRRIVERHGGALGLVDERRPGATFELRLPLTAG
jgi:signal transduction histidine kinase